MGRPPILIRLMVKSKDDERFGMPKVFTMIPEAADYLGLSTRGIRKTYHSKKTSMTNANGNVYEFTPSSPR